MSHEEAESLAALDAIGAATLHESLILRTHLVICFRCRIMNDEMRAAVLLMAMDLEPVPPPGHVRRKLFAAPHRSN